MSRGFSVEENSRLEEPFALRVLPEEVEQEHVSEAPHSPWQGWNALEKILVGNHMSSVGYERTQ